MTEQKDLSDVRHAFEVFAWTKREIADLKRQQDEARSQLELHLDKAEVGTLDDEPALSWGWANDSKFDWESFKADWPNIDLDQYRIRGKHREMKVIEK